MRLYLDTSVLGGYFEPEFVLWSKQIIHEIFDGKHIAIISDITLNEISGAPSNVRNLLDRVVNENAEMVVANQESVLLGNYYLKEKIVTVKYTSDALHIAIATVNKVDVVTSWNFKHIVNLNRIRLYNSVNLKHGYQIIEIRSPREIVTI